MCKLRLQKILVCNGFWILYNSLMMSLKNAVNINYSMVLNSIFRLISLLLMLYSTHLLFFKNMSYLLKLLVFLMTLIINYPLLSKKLLLLMRITRKEVKMRFRRRRRRIIRRRSRRIGRRRTRRHYFLSRGGVRF